MSPFHVYRIKTWISKPEIEIELLSKLLVEKAVIIH